MMHETPGDLLRWASVASYPAREDALREVVEDIQGQVDFLLVWLNGYDAIPDWLPGAYIGICRCESDVADSGKFAWGVRSGYHLTIDDDLFYPPDYVDKMVAAVERYGRRAIVTCHGKRFDDLPTHSYYHGASEKYHCLHAVDEDVAVHVPGSGVMAYHTDAIRFDLEDFPEPYMADIHVALKAHREGVGIICMQHAAGWIRHQPIDKRDTIWYRHNRRDQKQTAIINRTRPWRTHEQPMRSTTGA